MHNLEIAENAAKASRPSQSLAYIILYSGSHFYSHPLLLLLCRPELFQNLPYSLQVPDSTIRYTSDSFGSLPIVRIMTLTKPYRLHQIPVLSQTDASFDILPSPYWPLKQILALLAWNDSNSIGSNRSSLDEQTHPATSRKFFLNSFAALNPSTISCVFNPSSSQELFSHWVSQIKIVNAKEKQLSYWEGVSWSRYTLHGTAIRRWH